MSFHDRDLALERPQRLIRPDRPQGLIRAEPGLLRPGPRLVGQVVIHLDGEGRPLSKAMLPGLTAPGMGGGLAGLPAIVNTYPDYYSSSSGGVWPSSITQDGVDGQFSIWFAFNGTSTTVPTVPGSHSWSSIGTKTGTSCAAVLAWRTVSSSDYPIGTFTNATILCGLYYSGVSAVGGSGFSASAATTSIAYPALTLAYSAVGGSWIATGGATNSSVNWSFRSGQTLRMNGNYSDSQGSAGLADSNGRTTSNLSSTNVTFGATLSRCITFAVELY